MVVFTIWGWTQYQEWQRVDWKHQGPHGTLLSPGWTTHMFTLPHFFQISERIDLQMFSSVGVKVFSYLDQTSWYNQDTTVTFPLGDLKLLMEMYNMTLASDNFFPWYSPWISDLSYISILFSDIWNLQRKTWHLQSWAHDFCVCRTTHTGIFFISLLHSPPMGPCLKDHSL